MIVTFRRGLSQGFGSGAVSGPVQEVEVLHLRGPFQTSRASHERALREGRVPVIIDAIDGGAIRLPAGIRIVERVP